MIGIVIKLVKDFGAVGFGIGNMILFGWCFWKLFTNHLAHMSADIKENKKLTTDLDCKLDSVSERVAKIEGKIE